MMVLEGNAVRTSFSTFLLFLFLFLYYTHSTIGLYFWNKIDMIFVNHFQVMEGSWILYSCIEGAY